MMQFLLRNIRKIILSLSALGAVLIYFVIRETIPDSGFRLIKLTEWYALCALGFLYCALLISPLLLAFPSIPFRALFIRARRAIGVSAFFFGLLHASRAFFGLLGGLRGLFFLSAKYLLAVGLGFTALCILAILAATSFDAMVRYLGKRWKKIHRLVYLAGVFILIHALLLGNHFSDLSEAFPQIFFAALFFLLILEAWRFDHFAVKKFSWKPGIVFAVSVFLLWGTALWLYGASSFNIHSSHLKLLNY
jgi:DMSO/TMAO reductase YedYZ heme-binding membrane subunit